VGILIMLATTSIQGPKLLHAQTSFGTIVGAVTDPSQAAVPDVSITVTNTRTGVAREAKTNQVGNYQVESLIPGLYSVKAEHAGFQIAEVKSVELSIATTLTGGRDKRGFLLFGLIFAHIL
jgi:hypothetical protein